MEFLTDERQIAEMIKILVAATHAENCSINQAISQERWIKSCETFSIEGETNKFLFDGKSCD